MKLLDIFRKKKIPLTEEQQKWNKMWELWVQQQVDSPYAELMTYQSEVNNGGHGQYFDNVQNVGDLKKELSALENILSSRLMANLAKAYHAFLILEEKEDEEAEQVLENCDDVFYENEAEITHALEQYAAKIRL